MSVTTLHAAIEELQCVGCVSGPNPSDCPVFRQEPMHDGCVAHCAGTSTVYGRLNLGLPKGFDRVGALLADHGQHSNVRVFIDHEPPAWNHLNVPVWYHYDGRYTYVRTFCPRIGVQYADVIAGDHTAAVLAANPNAYNVADFESEID